MVYVFTNIAIACTNVFTNIKKMLVVLRNCTNSVSLLVQNGFARGKQKKSLSLRLVQPVKQFLIYKKS